MKYACKRIDCPQIQRKKEKEKREWETGRYSVMNITFCFQDKQFITRLILWWWWWEGDEVYGLRFMVYVTTNRDANWNARMRLICWLLFFSRGYTNGIFHLNAYGISFICKNNTELITNKAFFPSYHLCVRCQLPTANSQQCSVSRFLCKRKKQKKKKG